MTNKSTKPILCLWEHLSVQAWYKIDFPSKQAILPWKMGVFIYYILYCSVNLPKALCYISMK